MVWRQCVEDRGTGELRDQAGLAIRWADNAFPFWNTLANAEVAADRGRPGATLRQAATYMRAQRQPGFLWLFKDLLTDMARAFLPKAAEEAGLSLALSGHGMAGNILPLAEEPRRPELEFVRVRSDGELAAYGALNCRAYGFDADAAQAGFAGSRLWQEGIHAYLGLQDGVPVTAGGTVAAGDCLFVILIATAPEHQRKGYGEAVTRKALYEGGNATGLRA